MKMRNDQKKRSIKSGLPPGTLMHIGKRKVAEASINLMQFNPDQLIEKKVKSIKQLFDDDFQNDSLSWINIDGLHDLEILSRIGEKYNIHNLVLEDIVNTDQRPKFEDHDHFIFITLKMFSLSAHNGRISWEQVSFLIGKGFVVTFQEAPGDVFEPVRERIRQGNGRIRRMQSDYLAYALIDAVVDQMFNIQENIGNQLDEIEEKLLSDPGRDVTASIHELKRRLLDIRRAVWPLRELVSSFEKSESNLIKKSTRPFIRDVYDHCIQVIDNVEVSREITAGLLDMYLSGIGNRTNQVMKVLTIVATLFIPLTFIVGIYGMNFEYMPELSWPWAYPALMGFMLLVFSGMIFYFRKKKWL